VFFLPNNLPNMTLPVEAERSRVTAGVNPDGRASAWERGEQWGPTIEIAPRACQESVGVAASNAS
jgi:hypothetical protein